MSHWAEKKEAGSVLGMRILFACYRLFGRRLFRLLLMPVMLYFFLVRASARRASREFLMQAGQPSVGWSQSFRHFMTYGDLLLDKLAIWCDCLDAECVTHGFEPLDDLMAKGQGAVLLVSHLGNVDISMALAERWQRAQINALVHTAHAEKFNRTLEQVSGQRRLNLIQVADITPATAMMLAERLNRGELLAIAGDRTSVGQNRAERTLKAAFLGRQAPFPSGPFLLAALLRVPVYFLCCVKSGDRYDIHLHTLAERITLERANREASLVPFVQAYADLLARYARAYPLQWGNFYPFWSEPDVSE